MMLLVNYLSSSPDSAKVVLILVHVAEARRAHSKAELKRVKQQVAQVEIAMRLEADNLEQRRSSSPFSCRLMLMRLVRVRSRVATRRGTVNGTIAGRLRCHGN